MIEIAAIMVAAAALGLLVWVARHDAMGWTKRI